MLAQPVAIQFITRLDAAARQRFLLEDSPTGSLGREQVDSYLAPDGINLSLSERVEALRALFAAGVLATTGFAAFRAQVRSFFGTGTARPGGALSSGDAAVLRGAPWSGEPPILAGRHAVYRREPLPWSALDRRMGAARVRRRAVADHRRPQPDSPLPAAQLAG